MTPWKLRWALWTLAAAIAFGVPWWFARSRFYGAEHLEAAAYVYTGADLIACAPGTRSGAGGTSRGKTDRGISYLVKTPANYDAARLHPLIVVYAPSGANRYFVERFVGLTREATRRGFVIAFVDSRSLSVPIIEDLATIPKAIVRQWCIDERRVHLTGHSDGGTVSTAIAVLPSTRQPLASIVPSAAGMRKRDLEAYGCPPPLAVMVFHAEDDSLFPGYGRDAADWWAACNGCEPASETPAPGECLEFADCKAGGRTAFCTVSGGHSDWPGKNENMFEFILSSKRE